MALADAVTADDEALLADYLRRHRGGGRDHRVHNNVVRLPQIKRL